MRRSLFALFCLAFIAQTATSQLTLVPRIGVENSRALVSVNDNNFFTPIPSQFTPQAGIRLDYKFKKGHGVFAGVSTSNTTIAFSFTNPETSITNYFASRSTNQFRLEGGYQFNTKPVLFKNSSASKKSASQKSSSCSKKEGSMKQGCGSYAQRSHCGEKMKSEKTKQVAKKSMISVRFQPQVGMAFIPSPKNDFASKLQGTQTNYTYNAGNWSTALISGIGFEFAKGRNKLFQVNLQYMKGIGNLDKTTLTTQSGNKSIETNFASRTSAWSLSFGIPVSFAKKPAVKHKATEKNHPQQKRHCEQIRYRCGGIRI
jgi:hypothetical protein